MRKLTPLKIVVIYISAFVLWVVGTDILVTNIPMSDDVRMKISIAKGILFTLVSAFLLYWIILKYTLQLKHSEQNLIDEKKKFELIVASLGMGYQSWIITIQSFIRIMCILGCLEIT